MSAFDYINRSNFKEIFKTKTGLDIAIENDANCDAISEIYFGDENNLQDIAYVVLKSGIEEY